MISSTKNEEIWSGIDERVMQWKKEETRNLARIAKMSQGLRKFHNPSEIFAM